MFARIRNGLVVFLATLPFAASGALASFGVEEPEVEGHHLWDVDDPVDGFHHLWEEVMMDIIIIGVIFALITLYFLIKYRRKHNGQEGRPPKLSRAAKMGWVLIPVAIFMADDLFLAAEGWTLWKKYREVPENNIEIELESAMWSFNFTYPNGIETYNELRVPAGTPILVRMTSRDVVHSLYMPDFKVKEDSMPGRITYLWFLPKKVGEHVMTCAEYCGVMHSMMHGKVIVMTPENYQSWYKQEQAKLVEGGAGS